MSTSFGMTSTREVITFLFSSIFQNHFITSTNLSIFPRTLTYFTAHIFIVHLHQPEPRTITVRPLEIIQKRPVQISPHTRPFLDRLMDPLEMVSYVCLALLI